jgi:hypothetical protein
MKTNKTIFTFLTGFFTVGSIFAQNARVQIIHNAPDPLANSVDVYVAGNLLLDNFNFSTATPFIDVPGGVPLSIAMPQALVQAFRMPFTPNQ